MSPAEPILGHTVSVADLDSTSRERATARGGDAAAARLAALLTAIAMGDRAAFDEFYAATASRIYGLSLRVLRDPDLAQEVAQEVFLQVWTSAAHYDSALGSPLGWLTTVAHRRCVDRVRSEQASRDRGKAYGRRQVTRDYDTVSEQVEQAWDERAVHRCLGSLTRVQRQAIEAAYYQGRTYVEVAREVNTPLPTIKSRIRDGLLRLKNCLGVAGDV